MPGTQIWSGPRLPLHTEGQLLISGDEVNGAPTVLGGRRITPVFRQCAVRRHPKPGDTADRPVVGIDAFRRTALSTTHLEDRMSEDYFCAGLHDLI